MQQRAEENTGLKYTREKHGKWKQMGNTAGRDQTPGDGEEAKLNTLNTRQGTIKIK